MTITLVAGFGRCGSSLMMQMLTAGGLPATGGNYPSYEDERYLNPSLDWLKGITDDRALKALDPHRFRWPALDYKAIWLSRDAHQQALSVGKFLAAADDFSLSRAQRRGLARSFTADEPTAIAILRDITADRLLCLAFEDIISTPSQAASTIAAFVGGLDPARMALAVVPRPTRCLSYMMEFDQILVGGAAHPGDTSL